MKATENNDSVETKTNNEELKIKINVVGEIKYSDVNYHQTKVWWLPGSYFQRKITTSP